MKRIFSLMVIFFLGLLAIAEMIATNPVAADDSLQALATPMPSPTRAPVKPSASSVAFTIGTLKFSGSLSSKEKTFAALRPTTPITPGELVDNWGDPLVNDNFDTTFPITSSCIITEDTSYGPRQGRLWGQDTLHATSGITSIWPARGGPNGLDPANNYPPGLYSWLVCGPYDFTNAQYLQVDFKLWKEINDPDDLVAVVYSNNGTSWPGVLYPGENPMPTPKWVTQSLSFPIPGLQQIEGQPQVWVAVVFYSDTDNWTSKGAWVDDLKIWRYNKPITACANLDLGNKAVNISAYDAISESGHSVNYPAIRAGDTWVVQGLMAAGTHWVRLPILQNNGVFIDTQAYDRMIDTLCNAGISTMPLFNHESITRDRSDADNDATAASYRTDFANAANLLASHFKGRVKYWQLWNEPAQYYPLTDSHYAALLAQTASSIMVADPNTKIVAAGLDHAWSAENTYLNQVYFQLDQQQGGDRPFDVLAIHPYNYLVEGYNIDPVAYMHQTQEMSATLGDKTIIDKFVRTMEGNQDAGKKVWISEVGWNSSVGHPNAPAYAVNETFQALYLKSGFDILFNEARSVEKIFWYKYMDENVGTNQPTLERIRNGEGWLINHPDLQSVAPYSPSEVAPGFWGLYLPGKKIPKISRCAFLYYPQRCPDLPAPVFLPLIIR